MFDPTAFDNMKVITEGTLYDRDLNGEIAIIDRNDIFNAAKMSRMFNICFSLPEYKGDRLSAKIQLTAGLENLGAELLPDRLSEKLAGCYVVLQFFIEHEDEMEQYQAVQTIFSNIWGELRKITQTVEYNPLKKEQNIKNVITIDFERLVSEDQIADLVEMIDFMISTLKGLNDL